MKKPYRVMLFCGIYAALFWGIFLWLCYENWRAFGGHVDHWVNSFFDSLSMSLSSTLDIPLVWLCLPGKILAAHGIPSDFLVWLCGAGILLGLASGVSCLVFVPRGQPGRRTALLCLFWMPVLLDCAFGLADKQGPAVLCGVFSALPCLVLLGLKTVSLARRRRESANSSRTLAVYSTGLLANALSLFALLSLLFPGWGMNPDPSSGWSWELPLVLFPEILLIALFRPFGSINAAMEYFMWAGGIWICTGCCAFFCSRLAGTWRERKPALLCLAWFIYLCHFSVAFWIGGYSVRSIVYLFLPALAAMTVTVMLLIQAAADKSRSRRKTQILVLGIAVFAEIMAFLLMFHSVDSSAYGASC